MKKLTKKLLISLVAVLPLPSLSYAGFFAEVSPKVDPRDVELSFSNAVDSESLPEDFYFKMEDLGLGGVDDLFLPENKKLYGKFLEGWRQHLNGNVQMASSTISQIGGGARR